MAEKPQPGNGRRTDRPEDPTEAPEVHAGRRNYDPLMTLLEENMRQASEERQNQTQSFAASIDRMSDKLGDRLDKMSNRIFLFAMLLLVALMASVGVQIAVRLPGFSVGGGGEIPAPDHVLLPGPPGE